MIYLTGGGLTPKTIPVIQSHQMLGVLAQPASMSRATVKKFGTWAADNGCFAQGDKFDFVAWLRWLRTIQDIPGCLFATAPDVVGDAIATWERSRPFVPLLRWMGFKVALVAQDGLTEVNAPWGQFDVLFLGGSTAWKLSLESRAITRAAKSRALWVHMGRVNSLRRLLLAAEFGCDSVDGNFLGFGPDKNLPSMLRWLDVVAHDQMLALW